MNLIGRGLDVAVSLIGVAAWSFAGFVLATRFVSSTAGGLTAVVFLVCGIYLVAASFQQESRAKRLAAGACPRCSARIVPEHRHRRWDAERSTWEQPTTSWECRECGYVHSESWTCPACPDAV